MVEASAKTKRRYLVLMTVVPTLLALAACAGGEEEEPPPLARPMATVEEPAEIPTEPVVITIGNLTDLTGPGASGLTPVNMALKDLTAHYNEQDLIPGVRFKVIAYDGQWDPARDMPGYEWLREKGADLIITPSTTVPITLKPRVDSDEVVLFALATNKDAFLPPGYVFNLGVDPQYQGYTTLKWIAENDWDYSTKGPAKVGGAGWSQPYSEGFLAAMEEYCLVHPDQFEWEGGYLTNFSFAWGSEVEALRDCDYVYPGMVMMNFVREYRAAGSTEAKFVGSDPQAAFFGQVDDAELWDEIDGMLFLKSSRWWNEECEMVSLAKQLLHAYHPDEMQRSSARVSGT